MGVYDNPPPVAVNDGYAFPIIAYTPSYRKQMIFSKDKIYGEGGTAISIKPTSNNYVSKINSNVQYKKFKTVNRLADRGVTWKYLRLMNDFKGVEYNIDSEPINKYLPFAGINSSLTQDSKDFMQVLNYFLNGAKAEAVDELNNGCATDSCREIRRIIIADIKENFRRFVEAYSKSAIKAGVPCEQIVSELRENFSIIGLDDNEFIEACKGEKGLEVGRVGYYQAVESDCCIDIESNFDYKYSDDTFDTYYQRHDFMSYLKSIYS